MVLLFVFKNEILTCILQALVVNFIKSSLLFSIQSKIFLSNVFLFGEVMEDGEICKVLVEIVFGRKVNRTRKAAKERHMDVDSFHKAVMKARKLSWLISPEEDE